MAQQVSVDPIKGLDETLRALREFDLKLERKSRDTLKRAAVVGELVAKSKTPREGDVPSGFAYVNKYGQAPKANKASTRSRAFPRYDSDEVRRSIKTTTRRNPDIGSVARYRGFVNVVGIELMDPAGAIVAAAGTASPGLSERGRRFVSIIAERTGVRRPLYRILLPAVIATRPYVMPALQKAAAEQQAIVGRIAGRYDT